MFFTLVWHFCVVWYNFSEFFLIRMPFQIKITVFTYSLESGRADGFLFLRRKISFVIFSFCWIIFPEKDLTQRQEYFLQLLIDYEFAVCI